MDLVKYVEENFPEVKAGLRPFGEHVVVQLKITREKTKSGIVLAQTTRDVNDENTQIARVIALGPLAYRNRTTTELWPEGVWANIGALVLVPKWGGFRFQKTTPEGDKITFCMFKDREIWGGVDEDFDGLEEVI